MVWTATGVLGAAQHGAQRVPGGAAGGEGRRRWEGWEGTGGRGKMDGIIDRGI